MISRATPAFWRAFDRLSNTDQLASRRAHQQFVGDPTHNSLHFKKLGGYENLWSVRVTISIRAVGVRDGDTIIWVWIGTHGEFDSRFG